MLDLTLYLDTPGFHGAHPTCEISTKLSGWRVLREVCVVAKRVEVASLGWAGRGGLWVVCVLRSVERAPGFCLPEAERYGGMAKLGQGLAAVDLTLAGSSRRAEKAEGQSPRQALGGDQRYHSWVCTVRGPLEVTRRYPYWGPGRSRCTLDELDEQGSHQGLQCKSASWRGRMVPARYLNRGRNKPIAAAWLRTILG